MISLFIAPLTYPDPQSRKVLLPAESDARTEIRGEEGFGWYSVASALSWFTIMRGGIVRRDLEALVSVAEGETLAAVVSERAGGLSALFVGHFSSPGDSADFFVDTPLLTSPGAEGLD